MRIEMYGRTDIQSQVPTQLNTGGVEKKASENETAVDQVSVGGNDDKQGGMSGKIRNWIRNNITGGEKAEKREKLTFGEILSDYGDTHADFAKAGVGIGGAAGVAIGLIAGRNEVKTDNVELVWKNHDVKDPTMEGYYHNVSEVGHYIDVPNGVDSDGNTTYRSEYVVDGYQHRYTPEIRYDKVGSYTSPEFEHSNKWTPITGALAGLAGGAVVGGITGFIISVANKTVRNMMGLNM